VSHDLPLDLNSLQDVLSYLESAKEPFPPCPSLVFEKARVLNGVEREDRPKTSFRELKKMLCASSEFRAYAQAFCSMKRPIWRGKVDLPPCVHDLDIWKFEAVCEGLDGCFLAGVKIVDKTHVVHDLILSGGIVALKLLAEAKIVKVPPEIEPLIKNLRPITNGFGLRALVGALQKR
jgi:hypothetical protein